MTWSKSCASRSPSSLCWRVLLTVLLSSPDVKPSTIGQWSHELPADFATTAAKELDETSPTAEYGPPYNHGSGGVQHFLFLHPQRWLGVSHPIDTAEDYVVKPLETIPDDPALQSALSRIQGCSGKAEKGMVGSLRKAACRIFRSRRRKEDAAEHGVGRPEQRHGDGHGQRRGPGAGNDGQPAEPRPERRSRSGASCPAAQFFQTDYTKPLLFMADGGLLEKRAEQQHLLGEQWGLMNETGSYPGQPWLWLYALWYQVEPMKSSPNGDIQVLLIMGLLSLAFICIPFIPGVRDLPRRIPVYKLIWREHYRAEQGG